MKKTLLLLVISFLTSTVARAVTVDQLVANGGQAIETLTMCYKANSKIGKSHGCRLVKVSDTKVKIEGLYLGEHDLTFDLTKGVPTNNMGTYKNTNAITKDGNQLTIHYTTTAPDNWKLEAGYVTGNIWQGFIYDFTKINYVVLSIIDNNDGTFTLKSETPILYVNPKIKDVPFYDIFDELRIDILAPNATATHTVQQYSYSQSNNGISNCRTKGSVTSESYDLILNLDKNNGTFEILNLGNNGYAIDDWNNIQWLTGTFSPENHTIRLDPYQYCWNSDQWGTTNRKNGLSGGVSANFKDFYYYYLTGFEFDSNPSFPEPQDGTYYEDGVNHNAEPIHWVTNGGRKKTYEGATITLPSYTFYTTSDANRRWDFRDRSFDNTTIVANSADVTLESSLKLNAYDANSSAVYVNATIETVANGDYLDYYELYIVPGAYTSINDAGFVYHDELGHRNATMIDLDSFATDFVHPSFQARGLSLDNTVNLMIPTSKLNNKSANNQYSLFLKAYYTKESGLKPTFHNLVTYQGTVTGVEIIEDEIEEGAVEYFNMQGVRVSEPVPGSLYIKRQGGKVTKELYR
ncbi:MAG: hypothetical protein J1E63_03940 [Muribaculaceae bacterium]|nr:hypothetical protein [Muribaculaceae bacterium]